MLHLGIAGWYWYWFYIADCILLIYIDCILLVEGQNNQAEQMCFEQWCRFCGSTLFVFWRNVLHCSRMCLYVEAFVWYNVFLVPCFFRFVFGSIDVMFWGRGRPYTAAELSARLHLAPENNIGEKDNGKEKILVRRTRHGICPKIYTAGFSG